ncbi:hypothetical protein FBZ88_1127 [Nitrospirillum bahiense]|uniref:UPF0229 protein FBZ88_1127 n=2 Tax=Azospirillaceae TaxID=2829815 RepID=A0A560FR95_9PROT|nr:hypothetical protein FBZ88_1127 [Nitrospirillum amazonense]
MSSMIIVDRRSNPKGKSLANRQRFIRRAKEQILRAVNGASSNRRIKDVESGADISIPTGGISEPTFHRSGQGGIRDHVVPGNKEFMEGDTIAKPPSGQSGGRGTDGSPDGGGEDEFRFVLTREEFMDLFMEDLELPDLAKRKLKAADAVLWQRAGYSSSGSPTNLNLVRTMRNSLSRRIALKRPKSEEMLALEAEIAELEAQPGKDPDRLMELRGLLERQVMRSKRIPYIDPIDVRYNRFTPIPKPAAQAVMFCLMDVSGSMTEHMKDLAKRFFMLLYLFLTRRYKQVEVVFIRHTHEAEEVDEDTFFHSTETGGTMVSTALEEMKRIIKERYPVADWNIYGAQASDGDNTTSDGGRTAALLEHDLLPACQYYAYVEVGSDPDAMPAGFATHARETDLWRTYKQVTGTETPFVMKKVRHRREIYPVFRELFARDGAKQSEEATP